MEIIYDRSTLVKKRAEWENRSGKIGFVPTMGALHAGHISLIQAASVQTDFVVASIFVNPTQFNNQQDFLKYPVSVDQDLEMLMQAGCDAVFLPSVEDIYPSDGHRKYTLDLGYIGQCLEAAKRPGHFEGVVEVVHILFSLVRPDKVFFGAKDYQQVMVIRKLLKDTGWPIELISCPTVREPDGLAMSSRNRRLTPEYRQMALLLSQTLEKLKNADRNVSIPVLTKGYIEDLNKMDALEVDYLELVDYQTLKPLSEWNPKGENLAVIAVQVGEVRLIDNLLF